MPTAFYSLIFIATFPRDKSPGKIIMRADGTLVLIQPS
jgi:hypothetical protein